MAALGLGMRASCAEAPILIGTWYYGGDAHCYHVLVDRGQRISLP